MAGLMGRVASLLGAKGRDDQAGAMGRIARLGLSPRQQDLNFLWGVYRCMQYDQRKVDWSGKEVVGHVARDVIASQVIIPPGFVDVSRQGVQSFPLKFRRPSAPYSLVKVIVDRFTGLLFSEQQHPEIKVDGDAITEDWLRSVADVARLWQTMLQVRTYGGAMGSAAIGFQFVDGKPVFETHDPRWCFPEFVEHGSLKLLSIEKRYRYPKEVRDTVTGKWETKEFWYRRVIDQEKDTLFEPAPVDEGDEPEWVPAREVAHNFGFCPVVWVQNIPVQDSEDGDPDCPPSIYDCVEQIDTLLSQANRALIANCDPTPVITTKAEMNDVQFGSDNAIRLPDGDAKFLEIAATGPKAAVEFAEQLRKHVLEMAQCVLEHPDTAGKTATEVERMYQAMLAKADVMREQYGQKCILPLLEMVYSAATKLAQPRALPQPELPLGQVGQTGQAQNAAEMLGGDPSQVQPPAQDANMEMDGLLQPQVATVVRSVVKLPPRYERDAMGNMVAVEREPGTGGTINLRWPGYFQPTQMDVTQAVQAAAGALTAKLIDDETAIGYVAPFFKVEDKANLVEKIRAGAAQEQADMMSMMASAGPQMSAADTEQPGPETPGGEMPPQP